MDRDIKFRGKRTGNNEWIIGIFSIPAIHKEKLSFMK